MFKFDKLTITDNEEVKNFDGDSYDNHDNRNHDVLKIISHWQEGNDFGFLCKTKKECFWSDDSDCSCEQLIQDYFSKNDFNVRTVYCWCRVSTKKQAEDKHCSLSLQKDTLLNFAHDNYDEKDRFKVIEVSQTAYLRQSRELRDIVENCRENDVILIYSIDRLTRNFELIMDLLLQITQKGITLHSVKENITYTDDTKTEFFTKILNAQVESANIGRRIQSAIKYNRSKGIYGKKLPYGYRRNLLGAVVVNEDEQKNIDYIRVLFSQGNTISNIVQIMRGENRRGQSSWTRANIVSAIKTTDHVGLYNRIIDMIRKETSHSYIAKTLNRVCLFWVPQLWTGDLVKQFLNQALPFRDDGKPSSRSCIMS